MGKLFLFVVKLLKGNDYKGRLVEAFNQKKKKKKGKFPRS